jgi:hypothetical protein
MEERWVQWEPKKEFKGKYHIDIISDSLDGFELLLTSKEDENKKVKVLFGDVVDAYRNTDGSFRQKTIYYLDENYGTNFYTQWTFFKVLNSEYAQWLSAQSYKTFDFLQCIHFAIVTDDAVIDIVTNTEPQVEIGEEEENGRTLDSLGTYLQSSKKVLYRSSLR